MNGTAAGGDREVSPSFARTEEQEARDEMVTAMRTLDRMGLNVNASGNASVRVTGGAVVTPTGIPAPQLLADDMVLLDHRGAPARPAERRPTSEWRLHTEVLARRPDVGAIVHTHSPEATAAATVGTPLPPIHYVVARFGGRDVACAPYGTYGSRALADAVADTLGGTRTACLMANHGALTVGPDLPTAVALAVDLEWFCAVVRRAGAHGSPVILADDEIDRVAEQFQRYGQR